MNIKGIHMNKNRNNIAKVLFDMQESGLELLSDLREKMIDTSNNMRKMRTWSIDEAARLCKTSTPRICKYESMGKWPEPLRVRNNRRAYTLNHINKIRDILQTRISRPKGTNPIIVTVTNSKGGTGKTTTTCHLSQFLAISGLRVLVIDLDPQASSTWLLGGIIPDIELEPEETIFKALIDDADEINNLVKETYVDGLDIIPGNMFLQSTEIALVQEKNSLLRLQNALKKIKNNYDVILLDCGPNISCLTMNALLAADGLLIPIPPDMYDFASFIAYSGSLAQVFEENNKNLDFFRLIITKHKLNVETKKVAHYLRDIFGSCVLDNYIVDTIEISRAVNAYGTVYDTAKPRGGSKEAFVRAQMSFNSVNNEILDMFHDIWQMQIKSNRQRKLLKQNNSIKIKNNIEEKV